MIVIADTSPINYLVWIGEIDVLPKIYGRILIPAAVLRELMAEDAPEAVHKWVRQHPPWLEVRMPVRQPDA